MGRITGYKKLKKFRKNDVLLVDGPEGTASIEADELVSNITDYPEIEDVTVIPDLDVLVVDGPEGKRKIPLNKIRRVFQSYQGETPGIPGLVPASTIDDAGKFLSAEGIWTTINKEGYPIIDDLQSLIANNILGYLVDALVVKEVNNKFGNITEFITDETTGELTGYKSISTEGGVDTVHPFSSKPSKAIFTLYMFPNEFVKYYSKIPTLEYSKADFKPFDLYNQFAIYFDGKKVHDFTSYDDWNNIDISEVSEITYGIINSVNNNRTGVVITLYD